MQTVQAFTHIGLFEYVPISIGQSAAKLKFDVVTACFDAISLIPVMTPVSGDES